MQKKRRRRINKTVIAKALSRIVVTKLLSAMRTTPLGVLLVAGIAFFQAEALPATLFSSIPTLSYMILIFAMAITSCFSHSRFFFIALILFLSQLGIGSFIIGNLDENISVESLYSVINILLPLNILFFASLAERGILSSQGKRNFIFIFLQTAFIKLLLLLGNEELISKITLSSPLAVIAFIVMGGLLLLRRRRDTLHFKITVFSVLLTIAFAHYFSHVLIAIPLFYAAAGFIIIFAVIQDYYFKAYLDELTTLPSRRSLNEDLLKLNGIYVIAMVDIDFFKHFNDTYGHDAGDDVLRLIAGFIGKCNNGKAFRYGGEEFTILFPGKKLVDVLPDLEELRKKIANAIFLVPSEVENEKSLKNSLHITISIGASESTHKSINPEEVIKAADKALYRAKDQGRNCVSM